jgi:hypothetical protein
MTQRYLPVLAVALVILAGCSQDSTEDAAASYCSEVEELRAELVSFSEAITGNGTVQDAREQAEAVRDAYTDAREAGKDLGSAAEGDVEQAQSAFQAAVDDIDDDLPLREAAVELRDAAASYEEQVAAVRGSVGCDAS